MPINRRNVRVVEMKLDSKKFTMKLRAAARHALALAEELEEIEEIDSLGESCEECGWYEERTRE